jgi:hypothetical protein
MQQRHRLGVVVDLVAVANLAVAVAVGGVGELQWDLGRARVRPREASGRRQAQHALLQAVVDDSHHRVGRADTALRCRPPSGFIATALR